MTNSNMNKSLLLSLFLVLFGIQLQTTNAQSVGLGADFVNRYVWRGIDFGDAASIQPYIEYSSGGFTLGTWASYSMSPEAAGFNEHDIYMGYSFGSVSIGVTDYYFPTGSEFFNFENDGGGAHIIEPNISFTGGESFPVTFYGAVNIYNDPDHSIYLEASIPFNVGETELGFTIGGVPTSGPEEGVPGYYGNSKAAIINMSLSAGRDIVITDSFSLPLFAAYILNPYAEQSYLVFGISL